MSFVFNIYTWKLYFILLNIYWWIGGTFWVNLLHSYIYIVCVLVILVFLHKCLITLLSNLQYCIKSLDRKHMLSLLENLRQSCILPLLTDCWQTHWTNLSFIIIASHRFCIKMQVECTQNPWFEMILLHIISLIKMQYCITCILYNETRIFTMTTANIVNICEMSYIFNDAFFVKK